MAALSYRMLGGLQELAGTPTYKAWLLDQFGVLHDGRKPYPGAIATLECLASTGAKLLLLSNSSRRSEVTKNKMSELGFDPGLFAGIITSGELTHDHLLMRRDPWFARLGKRCLHMTWSARGAISLEELDLEVVEKPELADFILVHGTEALGTSHGSPKPATLEQLREFLEVGMKYNLPMIVANPDVVTVEARELRAMPGMLGLEYEKLGGDVRWMGKPDPVIYRAAQTIANVAPSCCIAVGDSLAHDIKGAQAAGIQSVFVAAGIHAGELQIENIGDKPSPDALKSVLHNHGSDPSYVIPMFSW
ncbi:hypothetical protein SELMODRAFT_104227 [Selaginella moellendorffii]|uniref:Uncharacterized protein n=1 Tax=Selaginella moellendorffii TaxID=88036 RepID=D8RXP7_SELML|nr:uncharacterized protein LOC9646010 isoform X2 [Selaginella moellendorffii]EFJ22775.1 hypothetical protein SELMODRAFT_104227 [Selaginella moellendorffii]|eukprot:XP_002975870.1 uncharacterized protein LOC9646010 isoform X2 [Selaginella moellendorffii]